ncbi:MAG: hypothetical protein ACI8S6_004441, partial [Myxococcota bacterium]
MTCRACGQESDSELCQWCQAGAAYLDPDAGERLLSLRCSVVDARPAVFVAMLRGGQMWEAAGGDAARALVGWMTEEQPEVIFNRWLAEDAVHGALAIQNLMASDRKRCMDRAPVWLAPGRPAAGEAGKALVYRDVLDLTWMYGLAVRLGNCATSDAMQKAWVAYFPPSIRPIVGTAMSMGRKNPTEERHRPEEAELQRAGRRWPMALFDGDGVVVCGMCGEGLPAQGACRWCGTDPEDEPAVV